MKGKSEPMMRQKETVAGNVYPKYSTRNLFARALIRGFVRSLDSLVTSVHPASIHEVGCGEGDLIARYAGAACTCLGTDSSEQIVQKAHQRYTREGLTFMAVSVYDLTQEHAAELVLCCEVFEHLEQPEMALDVLAGIARPYLVASVPREPLWRLLNLLRGKYWNAFGNTPGHLKHWSQKGFIAFLARRFDILDVRAPLPWTMVLCRTRI